ncbi:ComF family protein [Sandaracinobacteroides sp. A072]|uniref:ComF family protein n=1 Tax=Sandaracinobacteroides sp. A072 TaxID=3461146 RepID=UPI00404179F7
MPFPQALSARFADGFSHGLRGLVDLLMPPACIACKAPVAGGGPAQGLHAFCADCWSALPMVPAASCQSCGHPLPVQWSAESHCLGCLAEPPDHDGARAAYLYEGPARSAVLAFKNGRHAYAAMMAAAMARAAPAMLEGQPLLVPVPLHRWRLSGRGYNQAALLARALAESTRSDLLVDGLRRVRATPRSQGLTRRQRQRNVQGAFRLAPAAGARIGGRAILLVDDVMTSGATASACARVLKRGGAARVGVLTFARVAMADASTYPREMERQDAHGED